MNANNGSDVPSQIIDKNQRITQGIIWKEILFFAFPIILSAILQQFYGIVDMIVAGQFVSAEALGAVGSNGIVTNTFVGLFLGFSTGSAVLVARYYGAKDYKRLKEHVGNSIAMGLLFGLFISLAGLFLSSTVLRLLNVADSIFDMSNAYLSIYFAGSIFVIVYNMGAAALRSCGDSRSPFYYLILSTILNIILDLLFVIVIDMGVAGLALATVISQMITAILVVIQLFLTKRECRINLKHIKIRKVYFAETIKKGLPIGLQTSMLSLGNIFLVGAINSLPNSAIVMAGWTAAGRTESFFFAPIAAFSITVSTFVAQNLGAGKIDRVKKSIKVAATMMFSSILILQAVVLAIGPQLLQIFNGNIEVIEYGVQTLSLVAPFYILFSINDLLSGSLRGSGNTLTPFLISVMGILVFRVLWIIFVVPTSPSLATIALAYPISWGLTSLISFVYYKASGWLKKEEALINQAKALMEENMSSEMAIPIETALKLQKTLCLEGIDVSQVNISAKKRNRQKKRSRIESK